MRKTFPFILILVVLLSACTNKATKFFNSGVKEYNQEQFDKAIQDFQQAENYGAPAEKTSYYIAEGYRQSNRMHMATDYYKKAIESGTENDDALYHYAYALKANGNYESAKAQLKKYIEIGSSFEHIDRAKHELKNLETLTNLIGRPTSYVVENCKDLNTEGAEYSPMYHDDDLYFTSSRGEGVMFSGNGMRFTDIFEYKFDGITSTSGAAKPLDKKINIENVHEASSTFTPDGKTMVFSRSNSGKMNDPTQVVDLFITKMEKGFWTEPERLPFNIREAWDSAPCFAPDGKTLYFSSNRSGGEGLNDIWKTTMNDDDTWTEVENLGPTVNTDGEDEFPYVTTDGKFYFSSDGHPGYGELDIFVLEENPETGRKEAINLRTPINSPHDDFAITFKNSKTGFFTSNRSGGMGDDDIYYFEFQIKYFLEGTITGRLLDSTTNTATDIERILPYADVTIEDTLGNVILVTKADSLGQFRVEVKPEMVYRITAKSPDFLTKKQTYSTVGTKVSDEELTNSPDDVVYKTKIVLDPVPMYPFRPVLVEFPPIYYPYDKWVITKEASVILDDMVKTLNDNPSILVELGSHTDPRNTMKYNDLLSANRAKAAVDYILSKGVPKNRIYPKGYGERVPYVLMKDTLGLPKGTVLSHSFINQYEKTDKAMFDILHQLNRRTEFHIVGVIEHDVDLSHIEIEKHGETDEVVEEEAVKHESENVDNLEHRGK